MMQWTRLLPYGSCGSANANQGVIRALFMDPAGNIVGLDELIPDGQVRLL